MPGSFSVPPAGQGPLSGTTLAVKDMIAIDGHVSSFGLARWRETHPPSTETAPVLARLLAAGASIAGLATLDQLAYSLIGNVGEGIAPLNRVYPDRFTGGSSSGPAAAVAAGLAEVGTGTDTGGSIRVPAAACGLYGLRPTHGLISAEGVLPLAPSFDTVGILARELATVGRVLEVAAAETARGTRPVTRVEFAADCLQQVSVETAEAVRAVAAAVARSAGCELAGTDLGALVSDEVADLFARVQGREMWGAHGSWLAGNGGVLAVDVAQRVRRAEELGAAPESEHHDDLRLWHSYTTALSEVLPDDIVAVLPVMVDLPPLRNSSPADLQAFRASTLRYTAPASLTGCPELVIPIRHRASGKRLGVGLLGSKDRDRVLISLANEVCPCGEVLAI